MGKLIWVCNTFGAAETSSASKGNGNASPTRAMLCLTQVEASVDLKRQGQGFLEERLQERRMSGASTITPSNDLLLREFKDEGLQGSMHSRVMWRL